MSAGTPRSPGSQHNVEERLRVAGRAPAPEPRAAFAEALEDRLLAVAGVGMADQTPVPPSPRPRHWTALGLLAGTSAAVLAGVLVVVSGLGDNGHEVRVATATDTVMVLPDGTVGAVDPGLLVPDGARIVTLDDGRVVVGEVELGPDREAVVDKGALRPTPTTAPPPAQVPQPDPPVVTPPTSPPSPSPPPAKPEPQPKPVGPDPKPTDSTPDTKPGPAATDPAEPQVVPLKLEAVYNETTVKLRWSAYTGGDFAAYLVLRSDAPAEPEYPLDEHTTVVARITDPATVQYFDAAREPAGRSYRVVAVDEGRRLVGRSPAVQPQPAPTAANSAHPAPVPAEATKRD